MARSASGDSVVDRVARVLDAFASSSPTLSVSELSERTGLPLSTASRLAKQLIGHKLLVRDQDGRIGIGLRLWQVAVRASPIVNLRAVAMPALQELHATTGAHVQLNVLREREVVIIERLSRPGDLDIAGSIGNKLPVHASAAGLVLLAHAAAEEQEAVVSGTLKRFTDRTLASGPELRRFLAAVRQDGFAYCPGHIDMRVTSVAAPIHGSGGKVVAAMAVVAANADARSSLPVLMALAGSTSRSLRTPPPR